MALEITALASGSKGNAVLITSGEKRLLIDCGVSASRLAAALAEAKAYSLPTSTTTT